MPIELVWDAAAAQAVVAAEVEATDDQPERGLAGGGVTAHALVRLAAEDRADHIALVRHRHAWVAVGVDARGLPERTDVGLDQVEAAAGERQRHEQRPGHRPPA